MSLVELTLLAGERGAGQTPGGDWCWRGPTRTPPRGVWRWLSCRGLTMTTASRYEYGRIVIAVPAYRVDLSTIKPGDGFAPDPAGSRGQLPTMAGGDAGRAGWAALVAGTWHHLHGLLPPGGGDQVGRVLVLDCSAVPPKCGAVALAALEAARRSWGDGVVWVAPRRLIAAAAAWRPAACSAEALRAAGVIVVPSEGMRESLREALHEHTGGGAAAAACVVLPPQGVGGGLKTSVGECLSAVKPGGRVCLLVSAAGAPGQSKDDSARVVRAVAERQLKLEVRFMLMIMDCVLKAINVVLHMMDFILNAMNFILNAMNFILNAINFAGLLRVAARD